ncbi:hypothetical protein AKJ51_00220 [candidate division MSBL1 archaeon SCGC-AAA382A20]|uniref:Uncharacterized protein n=1 Tax=candidate division MSBL1 archaeon SCGC-AAA382A20 TaxID=1698280 RepID=A0A133VMT5_9EURY|nr:hypothetical protein AKJ51_00220 [candidate division MSBL1 archaeon SCGC-AAA382A20]
MCTVYRPSVQLLPILQFQGFVNRLLYEPGEGKAEGVPMTGKSPGDLFPYSFRKDQEEAQTKRITGTGHDGQRPVNF